MTAQKRFANGSTKHRDLSASHRFEVSRRVHHCSWGNRKLKMNHAVTRWSDADFIVKEKIGKGHFGNIYRAINTRKEFDQECETNQRSSNQLNKPSTIALKCFSKRAILTNYREGGRTLQLLKREINIHSHLCHDNILNFMGFFEGRQSFSLVLEYAAQGDLLNYMISIQDHERLVKARHFLWQITKALHYLETLQVAHRDIKPENIVVVSDCVTQNPTVKLCDFGWAIWFKPGHRRSTLCGTAEYCPPEMLARRHPYSAEYVDRWMLGVLAFELIHNCTPFATTKLLGCTDDYTATIFDKIRNFRSLETTITMKQNPEYLDFVSCLMQVEPTDRFSALKALEHSFFKSMRCFRSAPTKMQGPSVAQLRQIFQKAI